MTDKVIKYIAHNLPQLQYLFLDHLFNVTRSTVDYIAGNIFQIIHLLIDMFKELWKDSEYFTGISNDSHFVLHNLSLKSVKDETTENETKYEEELKTLKSTNEKLKKILANPQRAPVVNSNGNILID